ncbi:glycosyltransferase family 2 protein [Cellulomonas sp. KRMCY2]|uniref:glycosyltransferase family 2 protein n=1 Tax=Cellulomonas sp. KRMCY2 TaxID=1304865 RepID=UPI00045EC430|nr:glycosyltransferase family 2 protein [Cellulomonas sp. KRMCY2]
MSAATSDAAVPERGTLDIVVPLFNEAEGIGDFHQALVDVLDSLQGRYSWSVIYVIDPSPDGTAQRVREIVDADNRVRAVLLLRRAGHQMSLVAGMERSTADVVITMDGDLQHPPELIPQMLDLYETGVDVVQTVRARTEGQGWLARATSRGFYHLMRRLSRVPMVEGGADYRLMSSRVVGILCHGIVESDRFLRGLIPWLGLPTATLEFVAPARSAGQSKYSFRRSVSLAVSGVVSFSKVPLYLGIVLGLVVGGLGLVSGVVALVMRLAGAEIPAGWTTLVVMVAVLSGMQLVTLGLIGLYLGVVFDEAKKRPQILVAEVVTGRSTREPAPPSGRGSGLAGPRSPRGAAAPGPVGSGVSHQHEVSNSPVPD